MKKNIILNSALFGIIILTGCGQQQPGQTQLIIPAIPVTENLTNIDKTTSQQSSLVREVQFNELTLSIPESLKVLESKNNEALFPIGTQGKDNRTLQGSSLGFEFPNFKSWLIVPSDFNGYDPKNPNQQYTMEPTPAPNEINISILKESKISFATLEVRDLQEDEMMNGIVNISNILDLTDGEFPDGSIVSYSLLKDQIVGKNILGDDIYEYDYVVNEAINNKFKPQPTRQFNGALWIHDKKVYILQDQTQAGGWAENTIDTLKNSIKNKIPSMALSSKFNK